MPFPANLSVPPAPPALPAIMADDAEEVVRVVTSSASASIPDDQIGGNTRFYHKAFPELEECVMVNVRSIAGEWGRRGWG